MWGNAFNAGPTRHWLLDFLASFPKSRKKSAGICHSVQPMNPKPLHGATAQQEWRDKMQAIYNDSRQHPARLPLYRLHNATKWNGEKQAWARQARVVVNMIFLGANYGET
jgi:hypothetical protein